MILWKRYGDRCYSLSTRTAAGGEREWCTGYQSVRAAQVASIVREAR